MSMTSHQETNFSCLLLLSVNKALYLNTGEYKSLVENDPCDGVVHNQTGIGSKNLTWYGTPDCSARGALPICYPRPAKEDVSTDRGAMKGLRKSKHLPQLVVYVIGNCS